MTLAQFLSNPQHRNAWCSHDGFELYVTRGQYLLEPTDLSLAACITIANIEQLAINRGKGKFWSLVDFIKANTDKELYSHLRIENVRNHRLAASLLSRGYRSSTPYVPLMIQSPPTMYAPLQEDTTAEAP